MKTKFFFMVAALAVMSISANAQGTWKAPAYSADNEIRIAKGDEIANITDLTVTHSFVGNESYPNVVRVKSDNDAPVVSYNGVAYDNKTILQAEGSNGQFYFFSPAKNGTLDVAAKMGSGKNLFVLELDLTALGASVEDLINIEGVTGSTLITGADGVSYVNSYPVVHIVGKALDGTDLDPIADGTWNNSAAPNTTDPAVNQYMVFSFPVNAGKHYAVGCSGSKFQLIGMNYIVGGQNAIDTVIADGSPTVSGYYNFIGQRLQNAPEKGAYIETYTNGTSRKVLRK